MAGFSAVVVIFKRQTTDTWHKQDADRFHGMVTHSILASIFCFLPFLLVEFLGSDAEALRWCGGMLGISTGIHLTIAVRLERSRSIWTKLLLVGGGGIIVLLLILNTVSNLPRYNLGLYLLGVFWHILQAAILFVMLIWIPASQIDGE
jgi:hypothetical protein